MNSSIRFAWEDWDAKYLKRPSEGRRESAVGIQQPSSAARKMAACTPAGLRSSGQENGGRSTAKGFHSISHHVRSVPPRTKRLSATLHTATASKHTSSKRAPAKSVQSRGTQLDCTPNPSDARDRLHSVLRTPNIVRQLVETPLESASIAWSYFRSPSVAGQTPTHQQLEMTVDESPGKNITVSSDEHRKNEPVLVYLAAGRGPGRNCDATVQVGGVEFHGCLCGNSAIFVMHSGDAPSYIGLPHSYTLTEYVLIKNLGGNVARSMTR